MRIEKSAEGEKLEKKRGTKGVKGDNEREE
jgi:hypothetical protein